MFGLNILPIAPFLSLNLLKSLKTLPAPCAVLPYNFITVALHASAFVTVFNILLWTVGYGMVSGSHSFVVLLFAAVLVLTNLMKSFYHTINEYAIHSAPGKR